jgi:hypothetical protein
MKIFSVTSIPLFTRADSGPVQPILAAPLRTFDVFYDDLQVEGFYAVAVIPQSGEVFFQPMGDDAQASEVSFSAVAEPEADGQVVFAPTEEVDGSVVLSVPAGEPAIDWFEVVGEMP